MTDNTSQPNPLLSTANITGAPGTTIFFVVVGAAQYVATYGATMPTTPAEWIQFVAGLVIAVLGSMARLPQKATAQLLLCGALCGMASGIVGCAGTQAPAPGIAYDVGAVTAGRLACSYLIPDAQRDSTKEAVQLVLSMDSGVVAIDMNNSGGVIATAAPALYGMAWNAIDASLALSGITDAAQWTAAARRMFIEFVTGCRSGLPTGGAA